MIRKLFALIMFLLSLGAIVMALFGVVVIWKNDTLDSIASLGSTSAKEEYTGLMLFFGKTDKDHLLNFAQNWLGYAVNRFNCCHYFFNCISCMCIIKSDYARNWWRYS